jgi:23S rRNA (adenine2503-C2)-methyltransferase
MLNELVKPALFGKTLSELSSLVGTQGMAGFRAKQIADAIYHEGLDEIDHISCLPKRERENLSKSYSLGLSAPVEAQVSADGTKKYLYAVSSGQYVEAVYIPEFDRATLCVSSQAGCRMACRFCMTARQGLRANLTAGEILNQIRSLPEREQLTNIVYMGMGEPMDNIDEVLKSLEILTAEYAFGWGHKRITVSTVGVVEGLKRFLNQSKCRLALSLHSPFDEERAKLMPAQKANPLSEILKTIQKHDPYEAQRRVSFEYIMFAGVNDSRRHAEALAKMLAGRDYRINLIRFHQIPNCNLLPSDNKTMENFRDLLNLRGLPATIRASRGEDIAAACGMLSTLGTKSQDCKSQDCKSQDF